MTEKLLMGNEAIALGAMRAGVNLVTGYPGTPSTEILETVAKYNDGSIHVEWSVNEKSALEVAAGAAYAGGRAMVTMKQVGLNLASDPLMSLSYVGVKSGMVIVVADDPGPISSQTEQDTRRFSQFAKLAVFDPSTPEEAYTMIADAFEHSEKYGAPVLFRPTTRICHSCASVEILGDIPLKKRDGFIKDSKWVIFPRLAYANHIKMEANLRKMSDDFSLYKNNILTGSGKRGIATAGVSYAYACEALEEISAEHKLLKISTLPFPEKLALQFLQGLDEVLVIEELDPVIEQELIALCGLHHLPIKINGKRTGHTPNAGENSVNQVTDAIRAFFGEKARVTAPPELPPLPVRPPVLCAGCPHRASFFAVKEATKDRKAVYSGDIGCYTLGNAMPLDMLDTCLCMGAGITIAQGLHRMEPDTLNIAFVGDSTFFHTGISGIINAVYNRSDILIAILDNSTTAMTGNQPHPGTGRTMMGEVAPKISIPDVLLAIGVSEIRRINPFQREKAKAAVSDLMDKKGVRAVLFEAPCIVALKETGVCTVDREKCSGCKLCIRKIGCPAIAMDSGKARIDAALCTGCGLCIHLCALKAIGGAA